jgi:hypothetical protein
MAENTIPVLELSGDPLEREVCRHIEDLRIVLQPYSEIWFNHIFVRRVEDGARIADQWMNFAGSHYSALMRVFHALVSFRRLNELAIAEVPEASTGAFLLDVHQHWASYWEHIGSAIDNLALAFEDCRPPIIKEEARKELMGKFPDIEYAYNRRTQFIHSRIVPAIAREGIVTFRIRTAERAYRHLEPKESRWDFPYDMELILGDVLPEEWQRFLNAMEDVWNWLLSELRNRDDGRLIAMAVRFGGMSGPEVQDLVMRVRTGSNYSGAISNFEISPGGGPKSKSNAIPAFLNPPPSSGTRPST